VLQSVTKLLVALAVRTHFGFAPLDHSISDLQAARAANRARLRPPAVQASVLSLGVFVAAGEVARLLFGLLLLLSHAIERRFVERDLDCVVPAEILMLGQDGANLLLQVLRNLDFAGLFVKLLLHLLELLPQLLTAVEGAIGRRQQ
jgi:hypothetical protein